MIYIAGDTHGDFDRYIDFADKVETINDTALSKKYELLYQPSLTEFTVSPFIAGRYCL